MTNEAAVVLKKDVSVGEYDARAGLTLITLQRGRLMFNMGPPSAKRAAAEMAARAANDATKIEDTTTARETIALDEDISTLPKATRQNHRVFRSGVFTGRSLFAEEAVYLVYRGALAVYELEELMTVEELQTSGADKREPLSLPKLMELMTRSGHLKMAFLDVYTFLKDNKLHPRRHVPTRPATDDAAVQGLQGRAVEATSMLDVYKSVTETVFVTEEIKALRTEDVEAATAELSAELSAETPSTTDAVDAPATRIKKRKLKRLVLVFRVIVRSFRDAMPSPKQLRGLIDSASVNAVEEDGCAASSSSSSSARVSVKLAVANDDRSVVLFEVA